MKRLYLDYSELREGGGLLDDSDFCMDREPEYITVTFNHLSRKEPEDFFKDSIEVSEEVFAMDKVYLAVIYYSDGDTFGYTSGYWEKVGVYPTEEYARMAIKRRISPYVKRKRDYEPWDGYFSGIEGNDVICLEVR